MTVGKFVLLLFLLPVAWFMLGLATGEWLGLAEAKFRYRMTLIVDDNGITRTGSGIVEIEMKEVPVLLPEMTPIDVKSRGEAAYVKIGEKGLLIATLSDSPYHLVFRVFPAPYSNQEAGFIKYYANLKGKRKLLFPGEKPDESVLPKNWQGYYQTTPGREAIERGQLPLLVHFKDINDPLSVEKVDPTHLDEIFGAGIRLVAVTIEIIEEPIEWKIEEELPWLRNIRREELAENTYESRLKTYNLHTLNFKRHWKGGLL